MADLFEEKARDWDTNEMITALSSGIGSAIVERIPLNYEMAVMDFGAGTGLISAHLAPHVNNITAVDVSESMLEKLAAKPELQGKVEVCCQDILEEPLNREFDLIVSAMALHHVEDTEKLFRRFADILRPGGRVALADLDKEDGTFHPADVEGVFHHGFERDALESLMREQGFTDIRFTTAHVVNKEEGEYPIFLVTASYG
ncbi:class I SAM-dependent methyltransferase [Thiohalophilus sp.]|uniref:class I SAM-dependent methyltransferase n=1 Tax=Thiohalophilus sp. TaxID=3028392 RepID=UPI002ACDA0DA|nr:class I SAM-dependent methyltransferase [Thiohalophilus sp.]MDZ7661890.1 class I SAM-dependent methyltransferase [Thiohalophilus sp.]MDZ7803755.1 class I SAM-dependent methyltransferase [Thiohalophilus sp.]